MKFILLLLISAQVFAASNTTFNPGNSSFFSKESMSFAGQKITAVAAPSTSTNIDIVVADDYLISGAIVKAIGACEADEIKFQILSGTTVVPNGTFIDWYMIDGKLEKDISYPAKVPAGLKLRAVYKNTCSTNVNVYINYNMHKVLQ